MRDRASAHLRRVTVELVEGAGHAVSMSHLDLATDRLRTLLQEQAAEPAG